MPASKPGIKNVALPPMTSAEYESFPKVTFTDPVAFSGSSTLITTLSPYITFDASAEIGASDLDFLRTLNESVAVEGRYCEFPSKLAKTS